jgi:inorganic pyrophosphatase
MQLLGSVGMIDSNESDWKVIVINAADPLAASYNDISNVPKVTCVPQGSPSQLF